MYVQYKIGLPYIDIYCLNTKFQLYIQYLIIYMYAYSSPTFISYTHIVYYKTNPLKQFNQRNSATQ